jgi:RNA polymerase sigma-70 factor (ECF subfamily)
MPDMKMGTEHDQSAQRLDLGLYLDGLYSYAMALSGNRAEAEDLVQETCLRALRAVDRLPTHGSVKAWLFTILRHIWLNQVRRQRTASAVLDLDSDGNGANERADAAQDALTRYVKRFEREQVQAAIRKLPLEFHEMIILREYEELSYQEIAELLNCPLGTVMSRLSRARSKLRGLLPCTLVVPRVQERTSETAI